MRFNELDGYLFYLAYWKKHTFSTHKIINLTNYLLIIHILLYYYLIDCLLPLFLNI